jgi:hypothetical protein
MNTFLKTTPVLLALALICMGLNARPPEEAGVVSFSAAYPGIRVLRGRVIAESDPALSPAERDELWRQYGLQATLDWVRPSASGEPGFTYHELSVRPWVIRDQISRSVSTVVSRLLGTPAPPPLPSRELPQLIAQLNEDPRLHWAAPDALILEWADTDPRAAVDEGAEEDEEGEEEPRFEEAQPVEETPEAPQDAAAPLVPSEDAGGGQQNWQMPQAQAAGGGQTDEGAADRLETQGGYSAALLDAQYHAVFNVLDWEAAVARAADPVRPIGPGDERPEAGEEPEADKDEPTVVPVLPGPFPEFEFYRLAPPTGADVQWAPELAASRVFMQRCGRVYGTGQAQALAAYEAQGAPPLAPVTVCVADTGVYLNHPDLVRRLHPNSIDANYTSLRLAPALKRPDPALEITDREDDFATGMPRIAIRGRPAGHGTSCAGLVTRCTTGFLSGSVNADGQRVPAVRLLPASLKSDRAATWVGGRVRTPISSFIRLVETLKEQFPTGQVVPPLDAEVVNTGDVRVVTISASVPKSYFSDAEWRIVANLAGKAAGAVAEDLRSNDRLYVFAAGNEAQSEPNKPGGEDYVLAVSAAQAFDGSQAWRLPQFEEGSNMGPQCVSAPGEGLLTSNIYRTPNLAYLPDAEFHNATNWSTPRTNHDWVQQTLTFGATSGATPQVASLAALLYAQDPHRRYGDVLALIRESCAGRTLTAPYGSSRGLIDYRAALGWTTP